MYFFQDLSHVFVNVKRTIEIDFQETIKCAYNTKDHCRGNHAQCIVYRDRFEKRFLADKVTIQNLRCWYEQSHIRQIQVGINNLQKNARKKPFMQCS